MFEEHLRGDRALIAAILNQAITDAYAYKRPLPPELRKNRLKKYNKKKLAITYFVGMLMLEHPFLFDHWNILFLVDFMVIYKKKLLNKLSTRKEELAWDARKFIDPENKLFTKYCDLIDIDAHYMANKCHKEFYKFDNGTI